MRISIVIPTHNRSSFLEQTLHYLSQQELGASEMELIIVDDGSTDSTAEVVENFRKRINLIEYVYSPREEGEVSCVSKIRNLGIEKSLGDVITFLDCGVLVPPCFVSTLVSKYSINNDSVFIHYILGLYLNPEIDDLSVLDELSPDNFIDKTKELMLHPSWIDPREGSFDLVNDNLHLLPAPWALGWSCVLSASVRLIQKIGGFDEAFTGWGAEDIDFSYRLHHAGASFLAIRDSPALHLPHPTASLEEKELSNLTNMKMLHRKYYQLDTEMLYLCKGAYCNQVIGMFERLLVTSHIPDYSVELLTQINTKFLASPQPHPSLLIGIDNPIVANRLNTTHMFVYNKAIFNKFRVLFNNRSIHYIFGCDTPFDKLFFDVVVISDYIRLLGPKMREQLILEMCRISKTIFIIYTDDFIPWFKDMDGWSWADFQEIKDSISKTGFETKIDNLYGSHNIITINGTDNID